MISNTTFYILVFSAFIVTFAIIAAGYYLASKDLKRARAEAKKIERFYIPEDKIEEFYRLADNRKTFEGKHKFWKFVRSCFPELEGKGTCNWDEYYSKTPYVEFEPEQ